MQQIIITSPFIWAHGGVRLEHFVPSPDGQPVDMGDACAEFALTHGFGKAEAGLAEDPVRFSEKATD